MAGFSWGGGNGIINPTVNLLHSTEPTSLGNLSTTTWAIGSGGDGVGKVIHVNESSFGAPARFWIDNNANGGNRDFFQKLDGDLAGQYTFAVWAWALDDNADTAIARVFSEDGNNTLIESKSFSVNKSPQRISLTFTIDKPARIQFGMSGTGSMLFCQPMLNAGPSAMPYVIGI